MYNTKRQKNMIIGGLLAIVCIMAIGYAAFASNLNISGSGAVSSNWSVKITNITSKDIVGNAGNKSAPSYTDTTATFATTLQSPGDSITYDITVSNEGTLDAVLKKITLTNSNNPAITFETSGLTEGDFLLKNTTKTLTVKVTYNNSVTSQPDTLTANLTVTLGFGQKGLDSNGIAVPSVPTAGDKLLSSAGTVTSGSGLYADSVESGRYIYRGPSPDNYITFNDENAGWRIISVESDGTIKIIRDASIGKMAWDVEGNRSSLTSTYCTNASSYGCNAWASTANLIGMPTDFILHYPNGNTTSDATTYSGTVIQDASLNTYLNEDYYNSLLATSKSYITSHNFNVGTPGYYTDNEDIATDVAQEAIYKWNGKIALMNVTEFMRATTETSCTSLSAGYNHSKCTISNWMYKGISEWTLSPGVRADCHSVWSVYSLGAITDYRAYEDVIAVRPALYLKSSITLSGAGTQSNPYTISG